jgi:hypothetical protein
MSSMTETRHITLRNGYVRCYSNGAEIGYSTVTHSYVVSFAVPGSTMDDGTERTFDAADYDDNGTVRLATAVRRAYAAAYAYAAAGYQPRAR